MRSKLIAAAVLLIAAGVVAFLVLKPTQEPPPDPDRTHVVKPPMLRAPPRELPTQAPEPVVPPPVAVAAVPDASVDLPDAASAVTDPNAVARPMPGQMNHHPPPPHSPGGRFIQMERRYQKAQEAWTQLRSHKSPADQQKYDALLQQAGNELSSGQRQAGAQHLQEFVSQALDGIEP
jgi:hypothetical protein